MSVLVLDNAFLDFEIDRIATAEAGLKRHLATRPTSPRGHFLRGEIARWRGRTDTAIAAYKEAVRLDTTYADPHRELGFLYRELGRRQEARAALRRYMELSPAALDAPIVEDQLIKLENP